MTQVFAALDKLADLARVEPAFEGVLVLDGPTTGDDATTEAIAFGVPPLGEAPAPAGRVGRTGPNGLQDAPFESTTATGAISVMAGESGIRAARARAGELLVALMAMVQRDVTLGGVVQQARIGNWSWWPLKSRLGDEVLVQFDILFRSQL